MKKKIIALMMVTILGTAFVSGCGNKDNGSSVDTSGGTSSEKASSQSTDTAAATSEAAAQEEVTPTFMFFVSKSDSDYDKTMAAVEELKGSYADKVNFDIVDIDENEEAKQNFPVDGNTPSLIMLNKTNDIIDIQFKCTDKAVMENAIKTALK